MLLLLLFVAAGVVVVPAMALSYQSAPGVLLLAVVVVVVVVLRLLSLFVLGAGAAHESQLGVAEVAVAEVPYNNPPPWLVEVGVVVAVPAA